FFLFFIIGLGVSYAVTPLVAIAVGAKNFEMCGIYFRQSLLVNFILGIILCSLVFFSTESMPYLNQPAEVVELADSYLRIIALSIITSMVFQTYKQFIEGCSVMKPAMVVTISANIINWFTNWLLIYGNLGFPALDRKSTRLNSSHVKISYAVF